MSHRMTFSAPILIVGLRNGISLRSSRRNGTSLPPDPDRLEHPSFFKHLLLCPLWHNPCSPHRSWLNVIFNKTAFSRRLSIRNWISTRFSKSIVPIWFCNCAPSSAYSKKGPRNSIWFRSRGCLLNQSLVPSQAPRASWIWSQKTWMAFSIWSNELRFPKRLSDPNQTGGPAIDQRQHRIDRLCYRLPRCYRPQLA